MTTVFGCSGGQRSLAGCRVFVVEDSWLVAEHVKTFLEDVGVTVVGPAFSLAEAEIGARSTAWDIAIMDLELHGQRSDGLIADLCTSSRPIVVLTGHEVSPRLADAATAVLKKPIRPDVLAQLLRELWYARDKTLHNSASQE